MIYHYNDKQYNRYHGTNIDAQISGNWIMLNLLATDITLSANTIYKDKLILHSDIVFDNDVSYFQVLNVMTSSWTPTNIHAFICVQGPKTVSVKVSSNVTNGVIIGQIMIPKKQLLNY